MRAVLLVCTLVAAHPAAADLALSTGHEAGPFGEALTVAPLDSRPSSQLNGFDIVINPGAGLAGNAAALAAFNRGAAQWEAWIADPITVDIDASFAPLDPGVLGGAASFRVFPTYASARSAMIADAAGEPNDGIVAALPASPSFVLPSGFSTGPALAMQLTTANAKALGAADFAGPDGIIQFSSNFTFDFDNSDGVDPGAIDFESVAAHEIGHVLGFISEVDYIDGLMDDSMTASDVAPTALDMFRFEDGTANDPTTVGDFGTMPRNLTPSASTDAIFDQIMGDGLTLEEIPFSTGVTQGDGRQASHWKDNLGLGLMDPTLSFGQIVSVGANDLRSLDLIGYEIVAVPESRAWLLLSAVAGVGATAMRRRSAA